MRKEKDLYDYGCSLCLIITVGNRPVKQHVSGIWVLLVIPSSRKGQINIRRGLFLQAGMRPR